MFAKQQQLLNAAHGPGMYIRDSGECAVCHTHQGFIEHLSTGEWGYSAGSVDDVAAINCRTCHQIHTTYTASDYALTGQAPVPFRVAGVTVDFGNKANLCARCHQTRIRNPMPVPSDADYAVTSSHFGGHYGPQGDMAAGVGFFFAGDVSGPMSHFTDARGDGCPTCHMAEGSLTSGGHTFEMGSNIAGCEVCHSNVDDFDKFGGQTDIQELLDVLGPMLETIGIAHYDAATDHWGVVTGTYTANEAAAWWNFIGVVNDGSLGVHNPGYIKAILEGAIDAIS